MGRGILPAIAAFVWLGLVGCGIGGAAVVDRGSNASKTDSVAIRDSCAFFSVVFIEADEGSGCAGYVRVVLDSLEFDTSEKVVQIVPIVSGELYEWGHECGGHIVAHYKSCVVMWYGPNELRASKNVRQWYPGYRYKEGYGTTRAGTGGGYQP